MSGSSTPSCAHCGSLSISQRLQGLLRDMVPPAEESSAALHVVETNDPPLEVEIHAVRESITKEEARLRVLDANIAHMQSALAALSQMRDQSEDKIRLHEGVFSPLRRFPPEILGQIFLYTVPPLDELEREMRYTSSRFGMRLSPWLLTRICSRWRSISLSFPSLWANIILWSALPAPGNPAPSDMGSFEISDEEVSLVGYPFDMLKAQLTRSANAPLRVVLRGPTLPDDALAILLDSSARWVSLELPNGNSLCTSLSGRVPSLRKIDITESWWSAPNDNDSDFLVAPALHDLRLRTQSLPCILPWTQITCYQASTTWTKHLEVLPFMVNLLEAHLSLDGGDHGDSQATIVAPKLRRLYLHNFQFSTILALDNFDLPALEDLSIANITFVSFSGPQHSPCQNLNRLAITISDSTKNSFSFQQFPSVTDLLITADVMTEENVEANVFDVFEQLGTTSILPNLKRIALYFHFDDRLWFFNELMQLIHPRQTNTPHALESLSLGGSKFAFSLARRYSETLKQFREDGLQVNIDTVTGLEEWYRMHGWEPRFYFHRRQD
ncbi:hypothetical protein C8R47DRAFT_1137256 [Mycena vitilis]|nr:hypothetical protein C8R47DRAFT_1137256 [Mycena vitilis]